MRAEKLDYPIMQFHSKGYSPIRIAKVLKLPVEDVESRLVAQREITAQLMDRLLEKKTQ